MGRLIIKSIFLYIILGIIFGLVYGLSAGICMSLEDNFSLIIVIILFIVFMVWLFTKIIDMISQTLSFMYWIFCFIISLISLIVSLNLKDELTFTIILSMQFSVLMFLIPKLDGEWTSYLNTEYTIDDSGEIESHSWISREYTSGTVIKLTTMAIIGVIFALIGNASTGGIWGIFIVEAIYTLGIAGLNLKLFLS